MPSPHRRPTSDGAALLAGSPIQHTPPKPPSLKVGEGGGGVDLEAGRRGGRCTPAVRAATRRRPVLLGGAALAFLAALVAVAALSDIASHADVAARVAAKAKLTAAATASTAAAAATKAKSTAAAVLGGRPPARARPPTPLDRPAGLPRTAFDAHLAPAMTPGEALTLAWYASQAATYVEYGSGASTVQAAPLAGRALSVENGVAWCAQMTARADVGFWVAQGKLDYVCVDIGETGMKDGEGGGGGERERGWRG